MGSELYGKNQTECTWAIIISKDMARGRCRILVIEDDRREVEQILELLVANGYEVDLAANGDEGLTRARSCAR